MGCVVPDIGPENACAQQHRLRGAEGWQTATENRAATGRKNSRERRCPVRWSVLTGPFLPLLSLHSRHLFSSLLFSSAFLSLRRKQRSYPQNTLSVLSLFLRVSLSVCVCGEVSVILLQILAEIRLNRGGGQCVSSPLLPSLFFYGSSLASFLFGLPAQWNSFTF